jgi:hypothetical protein
MGQYTTTQSWGSRLMGSIKGVLSGIVLFILSFVVLWYNEGRAVKVATGLTEGANIVTPVFSGDINPANEGDLIHVTDKVISEDTLLDYDFKVTSTGLRMKREVEMYQWAENKSKAKKKNLGGSETTTSTYTYEKKWSKNLVKSSGFKEINGHINPDAIPYQEQEYNVQNATIGAFKMSEDLLSDLNKYNPISLNNYEPIVANAKVESNSIYIGTGDNQYPQIGDVKITFSEVYEQTASIISKQSGETFEPYNTENGSTISLLQTGEVSPEKMFSDAQAGNATLTWILRLVGFLMMFFGITMIFKPLVIVADVLPFLGNLLDIGIGFFAGIISITLSLIVIALAWIAARPILGISFLVLAGLSCAFIFIKNKKAKGA